MKTFDPTPEGVTYFRINAIGFGVSIFAMFAAMYWWMGLQSPLVFQEPIVLIILGVTSLFTAGFYVLPALVPRKRWGYFVAWIQLALSLTSMTATLPSLAVLMSFTRDEVKQWFDRKPIGFGKGGGARGPRTAVVTALIGYYTIISVIPFGIAYAFQPDRQSGEVVEKLTATESHVTFHRRSVTSEEPLGESEELRAETLLTEQEWNLSAEDRPVAVTVWASHCRACSSQFDQIAEANSRIGTTTKHVTLALDCEHEDGHDHRARVKAKLAQTGISSQALCAGENGLDVSTLPTTVYFDADGRRRATAVGYQTHETLDDIAHSVEQL